MEEGYIILKHQVFQTISDEEVLSFLPKVNHIPKYRIVEIKREIISMDEIHTLDNISLRVYQRAIVNEVIRPLMNQNPNYRILYFGATTIPLALHLGYCIGGWKDIDVYILNRESNQWQYSNTEEGELTVIENFVKEEFPGPLEVIYKVEATYLINDMELKEAVEGLAKTIELKLKEIGKDVFKNQMQLKSFAHKFSLGLDSIANNLHNADKIHLFPTVPVGLAFLMGTKINPTITKPIVTYQYNTNQSPKYQQVLILQESPSVETIITDEDQKFINLIKVQLKSEIEDKIAAFVEVKTEEKGKRSKVLNWVDSILTGKGFDEMKRGFWKTLPDISKTILGFSKLSNEIHLAGEGFYISEDNEWQISDRFIYNIKTRLEGNQDKILKALRMFIFHETVHVGQALTNHTANNIGRFPRVLEEVDYIADVWAMLHEYAYSKINFPVEARDLKTFFKDMIFIASNTMWAFDDLDSNTEEMQIRRVNRYLIWYWNYLQIEDRGCKTIDDIIDILANKPLIEIRGLDIRAQSQRTVFRLTNYKIEELELAYFDPKGPIRRISNSGGIQLNELVKGFKERRGEKILHQLKSWFHQIRIN